MSLLYLQTGENESNIARKVFEKHFEADPQLGKDYDERRKMLMFDDIMYNLSYLHTAIQLDDDKIFVEYSLWLYHLLCNLMKDLDRARVKDQMVFHYKILNDVLGEALSAEDAQKADKYLHQAIEATEYEAIHFETPSRFEKGGNEDIKTEYLNYLFKSDTKGALSVIEKAAQKGLPLEVIYEDILQDVMHEVGNLWHQHLMTVDKEHYCTSTTQMVLSQFYPVIFSAPRNGHKILTCCVGSELHEMGIRMVSDLFEYHGWDSVYLGAAVPKEAILNAISENFPDLLGLSVTMPQHLPLCREIVYAVREQYPDIKIAVGGRAFLSTHKIWLKWDVDVYAVNAVELVNWAEENIV